MTAMGRMGDGAAPGGGGGGKSRGLVDEQARRGDRGDSHCSARTSRDKSHVMQRHLNDRSTYEADGIFFFLDTPAGEYAVECENDRHRRACGKDGVLRRPGRKMGRQKRLWQISNYQRRKDEGGRISF